MPSKSNLITNTYFRNLFILHCLRRILVLGKKCLTAGISIFESSGDTANVASFPLEFEINWKIFDFTVELTFTTRQLRT